MAKSSLLFGLFVVLAGVLQSINCEVVTIHELKDFKGDNYNFTMYNNNPRCVNIPFAWLRKVSSISTENLCLKMYNQKNCKGDKINLYPGTSHHNDLSNWLFDDSLASLRVCSKKTEKNSAESRNAVQITTEDDKLYHLTVVSCKNIPTLIKNGNMKNLTTHGVCYKFYRGKDCTNSMGKTSSPIDRTRILQSIVSMRRCKTKKGKLPVSTAETTTPSSVSTDRSMIEKKTSVMYNYGSADGGSNLLISSSVKLNDNDQKLLRSLFGKIVSQSNSEQPLFVTMYSQSFQNQSSQVETTTKRNSYNLRKFLRQKYLSRKPVDL